MQSLALRWLLHLQLCHVANKVYSESIVIKAQLLNWFPELTRPYVLLNVLI